MAACGQALRRFIADYGAGPIRCGRRRICAGAGQGPPAAFRCRRTWPCGDSLQSLALPGRHCASVPTLRTKPGCLSEPAFDNRADRSEPDSSTSLLADSYVRVGRQWAALMATHNKYLKFLLATCGHIPMAADTGRRRLPALCGAVVSRPRGRTRNRPVKGSAYEHRCCRISRSAWSRRWLCQRRLL